MSLQLGLKFPVYARVPEIHVNDWHTAVPEPASHKRIADGEAVFDHHPILHILAEQNVASRVQGGSDDLRVVDGVFVGLCKLPSFAVNVQRQ
jgi:hypothetical protein